MPVTEAEIRELLGEDSLARPNRDVTNDFHPTDLDRRQVSVLIGLGLTRREVASVIFNPRTRRSIGVNTLTRHFQEEIDSGPGILKARVLHSLVSKALSKTHPKAATCAMFIAKCRYGWRQEDNRVHIEVAAKAGVLVAPALVSPEEWIAQEQLANHGRTEPGRLPEGHPGNN